MKRVILYSVILLSIFISVLVSKYFFITKNNIVPYCNLTDFSTGSHFIYLDIKLNGEKYTIVEGNMSLYKTLYMEKSKLYFFSPIYTLWINEVIKNDWSIKVNKHLYRILEPNIVNMNLVNKYEKTGVKESLLKAGKMPDNLNLNSAIYLFLINGINCYTDCESGEIIIERFSKQRIPR